MGKNGHVHFADETRQAALFETMILAAGSDGNVSRVEVEEIYRRVRAHVGSCGRRRVACRCRLIGRK